MPDCREPMDRRGLCRQHYGQFYYERKSRQTEEEKKAFEQKMIYEGLVLDAYAQRVRRRSNPFSQAKSRA
ncbi:MAG: hypothetical protein MI861_17575, partial [Pirellulales bacterium]|nr:hypothetical protein [Pirellulales bacterium]